MTTTDTLAVREPSPEESGVIEREEIDCEFQATDPGDENAPQEQADLLRYVRLQVRDEAEIAREKQNHLRRVAQLERQLQAREERYGPRIREIVERRLQGSKKRSILTPWGVAGLRKLAAGVAVIDEAKLLAATLTDLCLAAAGVRKPPPPPPPPSVSKSALNAYVKSSGIIPPGCEAIPESETFYVREK